MKEYEFRWDSLGDEGSVGENEEEKSAFCERNREQPSPPPVVVPPKREGEESEILPCATPPERDMTPREPKPMERSASNKETESKKRCLPYGGYLLVCASLTLFFFSMICLLCLIPSEEESLPVMGNGILSEAGDGEKKIVYVREYGSREGAISTPELYESSIASVVSICAENDTVSGIGSGFVLREDGYIATAYHVVADMKTIKVIHADGREWEATLVGGDAMTDLAVLKIDEAGLQAVRFGVSADLLPGERVIAIGTPASLDYAGSVSSGEVSYVLRTVKIYASSGGAVEKKMKLIQTNAPVNPGNSGCPLFNEQGEVVGMVTMKLGQSFTGMGFAVPSDGARGILDAFMAERVPDAAQISAVSVPGARLGITGQSVVDGTVRGVRIASVSEENDAWNKLAEGDVITKMGNFEITDTDSLVAALSHYDPSDLVVVEVLRNGQLLCFEIILGS